MSRRYTIGILLALFVILLATFSLASFYIHTQQEAAKISIEPSPTPVEPDIDKATPENIAANFYSSYQTCMAQPSSPNTTQTLSQFCQTNNRLTLESFNNQIALQKSNSTGIDPVFCAEAPPQDLHRTYLHLGTTVYQGQTAIVPIIEKYPTKEVTIQFYEEKNRLGQWKVAKIVCQ